MFFWFFTPGSPAEFTLSLPVTLEVAMTQWLLGVVCLLFGCEGSARRHHSRRTALRHFH